MVKEKNKIEYVKVGDYYLPNLILDPEKENYNIKKYGRMKLKYLKEFKKAEYIDLLAEENLNKYLYEIDKECEKRLKLIITQIAKQENINEELKASNQLEWVAKMNSIKNIAEEIIMKEIIYA